MDHYNDGPAKKKRAAGAPRSACAAIMPVAMSMAPAMAPVKDSTITIEPLALPTITVQQAAYVKVWARLHADVPTRQCIEALVSPNTQCAYIKISDINPTGGNKKPIYRCSELKLDDDDGTTYIPTERKEVVIKAARLQTREVENLIKGKSQLPKRRGADEPIEELKAMSYLTSFLRRSGSDKGEDGPLVPLLDCFVDDENWLYIIQPYYGKGDLVEVVGTFQRMPQFNAQEFVHWCHDIFLQLLDSLTLLKKAGVAHLDISPENCFIDEAGSTVSLGDLGMALYVGGRQGGQEPGENQLEMFGTTPSSSSSFSSCCSSFGAAAAGGGGAAASSSLSPLPPRTPLKAVSAAGDIVNKNNDTNHQEGQATAAAASIQGQQQQQQQYEQENACQRYACPVPLLTPQRFRGKVAYAAPEVLAERPYDPFAADIFSLGCTLYAILTGRLLLESVVGEVPSTRRPRFEALLRNDWDTLFTFPGKQMSPTLSPQAADLIQGMCQPDPTKRMTLEQVLAHPWVRHSD